MDEQTFFKCTINNASETIGVNTEMQGILYIIYAGIQVVLLIIYIYQVQQMIRYLVYKKFRFLFITNCLFLLFFINKILYCLRNIAFCINETTLLISEIINFELFVLPINFFNLSMCESLFFDCPYYYYRVISILECLRKTIWNILFPLIVIQCLFYFLDNFLQNNWIFYFDFFLRYSFYIITLYIFFKCSRIFAFLYNKNEKIKLITSKKKFLYFYWIIIISFIYRLLWSLITSCEALFFGKKGWFYILVTKCFTSGCLYPIIIDIIKMLITEGLVCISIAVFLNKNANLKLIETSILQEEFIRNKHNKKKPKTFLLKSTST